MKETYDGQPIPSKTLVRKRNQCLLLISLEIEIPKYRMKRLPGYMTDAVDIMRQYVEHKQFRSVVATVLAEWFMGHGVRVKDINIRVSK